MRKFIGEYFVFALAGSLAGIPFPLLSDWRWWAWMLAMILAIQLHVVAVQRKQ